jgi:hypothetical protein
LPISDDGVHAADFAVQARQMDEERVARLVAHMLRTAKAGNELDYEITYGPETEDTISWTMMASGDVEVTMDSVYPAMHALPTKFLRTLTKEQAHDELVARLRTKDDTYVPYLEKKWGITE